MFSVEVILDGVRKGVGRGGNGRITWVDRQFLRSPRRS